MLKETGISEKARAALMIMSLFPPHTLCCPTILLHFPATRLAVLQFSQFAIGAAVAYQTFPALLAPEGWFDVSRGAVTWCFHFRMFMPMMTNLWGCPKLSTCSWFTYRVLGRKLFNTSVYGLIRCT